MAGQADACARAFNNDARLCGDVLDHWSRRWRCYQGEVLRDLAVLKRA